MFVARPHVREQPAVVVALLVAELELDVAARDQCFERVAGFLVQRVVALGRVDLQHAHALFAPVAAHVQRVAVGHVRDFAGPEPVRLRRRDRRPRCRICGRRRRFALRRDLLCGLAPEVEVRHHGDDEEKDEARDQRLRHGPRLSRGDSRSHAQNVSCANR